VRGAQGLTLAVWERRTTTPLLWISLLFLGVLAMPVIDPDPSAGEQLGLRTLNVAIWAAFAVDYFVRLRLTDDRRRFVRTHLADLAVVLLPALRPLRLLRLLSIARVITARSKDALVGSVFKFVAGAGALLVFVGAVGVLNFERPAKGANITSFGDALWWAATTITTVGYGDRFPVTWQGRTIAVALMLVGIALLGILTAGIAAWFVQVVSREDEIEEEVRIEARELHDIRDHLARIEARLSGPAPTVEP
jgi:voltage-gated potassium channel